jgi:hypothetical protein
MHYRTTDRILTMLFACMFWFGLQAWSPSVHQAAELPDAVVQVDHWGSDDRSSLLSDPGSVAPVHCALTALSALYAAVELRPVDEVGGSWSLLPITGFHPSAP